MTIDKTDLFYFKIDNIVITFIVLASIIILFLTIIKRYKIINTLFMLNLVIYVFNPSIILRFIYLTKKTNYYIIQDTELLYFWILLFSLVAFSIKLKYEHLKNNILYLIFIIVSIWGLINLENIVYNNKIKMRILNYTSSYSLVFLLIIMLVISCKELLKVLINKDERKNFIDKNIIGFFLILQVTFPYILFSRTRLVDRPTTNFIDYLGYNEKYPVSLFNINHIFVIIFFFIFTIEFICLFKIIDKKYLESYIYGICLTLFLTDMMYNISKIGDRYLNLRILPDSPCVLCPILILLFLKNHNKILFYFISFINLPLAFFSVIILFTGSCNNIFCYFPLSSIMFHIYITIMALLVLINYCNKIPINFCNLVKTSLLFLSMQILGCILGNLQRFVEYKKNIDLQAPEFYGFMYDRAPFPFLKNVAYIIGYDNNVIHIYPINMLIIFLGVITVAIISYSLFYFYYIKCILYKT